VSNELQLFFRFYFSNISVPGRGSRSTGGEGEKTPLILKVWDGFESFSFSFSFFFFLSSFFFLSFSSPSPSPFLCDRSQPSPAMETTGSSGTASLSLLKIGDFITLYSEEVRFLPENLLTLTGVPTKTKKSPS